MKRIIALVFALCLVAPVQAGVIPYRLVTKGLHRVVVLVVKPVHRVMRGVIVSELYAQGNWRMASYVMDER